jgi:glycerophosphoryl diester phosphodiesterase
LIKGKWFQLFLIIVIALAGLGKDSVNASAKLHKESVFANMPEIVHGLGHIEGHYITNSREALLLNYKRGFRVFEVDLNMTSDNRLVARHDWFPEHYQFLGQDFLPIHGPIPFDIVMSLKIHGKYNALSWEEIVDLLQKYPDLYFVTDTKEKDEEKVRETFSYLVSTTKKVDPKLLDRIIPQIYDQPMLSYIESYHDFKEVIFTLYHYTNADLPTAVELADWSDRNNITAIAGFPFRLTEELRIALREKNIAMYTHTINNPEEAAAFREAGIGIYTDYLHYDGGNFVGPVR